MYIDNLSFDRLIPNYDRKETLFYCDPPYRMLLDKPCGKQYYQHTFTEDDHTRLRNTLKGISGRFILSYDDHPTIRKLYSRFRVVETAPVLYSMNNRQNSKARRVGELIITNF